MNKLQYCVGTFVLLFASTASVSMELRDDSNGMRCAYFHSGFRFQWKQQGGDWSDALDVAYGDTPFAVATVQNVRGTTQSVEWDITGLARTWQRGAEPMGGVLLRQLSKNPKSSLQFRSREFKDIATHPSLFVEWADGSVNSLEPSADTTITCTSKGALGSRDRVGVGQNGSTIVIFPFAPKPGAEVRKASLVLHSHKQYGPPSQVGVFRLDIPFGEDAKPKQGLAARYLQDANIESDPSVVFSTGFESGDWVEEWSASQKPRSADQVSRDPSNRFQPLSGNALKVTIEQGKKTGLNLLYKFEDKTGYEPEQMNFRYYLRLGDNWEPAVGGKMPGFAGTYNRAGWGGRRSDGLNGWSARGSYIISHSSRGNEYALGNYAYHADTTTKFGSAWGWNLGIGGKIEKNRWYSIEQFLKLNTPGKSDGELKAWIDGVLVFDSKDLRFRDTPDLRIETLWMNVYHGGTQKAPKDLSVYIDNVVVAREYIGPARGLAPEQ